VLFAGLLDEESLVHLGLLAQAPVSVYAFDPAVRAKLIGFLVSTLTGESVILFQPFRSQPVSRLRNPDANRNALLTIAASLQQCKTSAGILTVIIALRFAPAWARLTWDDYHGPERCSFGGQVSCSCPHGLLIPTHSHDNAPRDFSIPLRCIISAPHRAYGGRIHYSIHVFR